MEKGSLDTVKQITRSNYKEEWQNDKTMATRQMTTPNVNDDIEIVVRQKRPGNHILSQNSAQIT